jgi:hypothetical protein
MAWVVGSCTARVGNLFITADHIVYSYLCHMPQKRWLMFWIISNTEGFHLNSIAGIHFKKDNSCIFPYNWSHLGGVVVNVFATGPKGCELKRGWGDGFLMVTEVHSICSFRWEVKPEVPCRQILQHAEEPYIVWLQYYISKIQVNISPPPWVTSRCLWCSQRALWQIRRIRTWMGMHSGL